MGSSLVMLCFGEVTCREVASLPQGWNLTEPYVMHMLVLKNSFKSKHKIVKLKKHFPGKKKSSITTLFQCGHKMLHVLLTQTRMCVCEVSSWEAKAVPVGCSQTLEQHEAYPVSTADLLLRAAVLLRSCCF